MRVRSRSRSRSKVFVIKVEDVVLMKVEVLVKVELKVIPLVRPVGDTFLGISEKPLPPSRTEDLSSFLSAAVVSIGSSEGEVSVPGRPEENTQTETG